MHDASATLRNHLIASPRALIRGNLRGLTRRLTDDLRIEGRPYLRLTEAELQFFPSETAETFSTATVLRAEVAWAHEFVELSGDPHRKRLADPGPECRVRIFFARPEGLVVDGIIPIATLDAPNLWMVVRHPIPDASTPIAERHADAMQGLPWIVCHLDMVEAFAQLPDTPESHG